MTCASDSLSVKAAAAAPFAGAALIFLASGWIAGQVADNVKKRLDQPKDDLTKVPSYLRPAQVEIYLSYAADAASVFAATFLTFFAIYAALAQFLGATLSTLFWLVALGVSIGLILWLRRTDPTKYATKGKGGLTPPAIVGLIANVAAIVLVMVLLCTKTSAS